MGRVVTAPETPAALLRRAADRLDALASRATSGPWRTADVEDESEGGRGDADWMATLNPAVAPHLSSWLRGHADYIEGVQCSATPESLAFARSILGEKEAA